MSDTLRISDDDIDMLTALVIHEARNEPEQGQRAVVDTVLNRAAYGKYFPRDVKGVMLQRKQFTDFEKNLPKRLKQITPELRSNVAGWLYDRLENGTDASNGALWYYNPSLTDKWGTSFASRQTPTARIGGHAFFNSTNSQPKPQEVPGMKMAVDYSNRPVQFGRDYTGSDPDHQKRMAQVPLPPPRPGDPGYDAALHGQANELYNQQQLLALLSPEKQEEIAKETKSLNLGWGAILL